MRRDNSFWQDAGADLFRDPRAMRTGDVVTVKISIKDKASLDNTSERSRDSSSNHSYDLNYNINAGSVQKKGDATLGGNAAAKTSTKGEGAITRSESIELLVAAVVTDVLPNGNLVISGTQEVRVNFEVRVLSVAGVLRPRDIATDNTVSYDKIAEARISYGGRGRHHGGATTGLGPADRRSVRSFLIMAGNDTNAEAQATVGGQAPAKKPSMMALVAEIGILTCFAIGAGGLFGMQVMGGSEHPAAPRGEAAANPEQKPKYSEVASLKPLPPIMTNLAGAKANMDPHRGLGGFRGGCGITECDGCCQSQRISSPTCGRCRSPKSRAQAVSCICMRISTTVRASAVPERCRSWSSKR